MGSHFQKVIWIGFLVTIAIISWLAITSYTNNKIRSNTERWISHANTILYHSEEILSLTIDLEAGQRGFGLTGIEEFLEPTVKASEQLLAHTQSLLEITRDNPAQTRRIEELEQIVRQKIKFTNEAVEARRVAGYDAARVIDASITGKRLTDNIRKLINQIQAEENRLVETRTRLIREKASITNSYFVGLLFATGLILVVLFYLIYVNLKARNRAEFSLRAAAEEIQDIYDNAPCGYHSVDENGIIIDINNTWLQWLKYGRSEVVNKMTFADLLIPEHAKRFKDSFEHFKKQGESRDEEFAAVRKDGSTFFILVNSTAIYDKDGNYHKSRSTVIDFTEQKKALQRIEQLNNELESFSYSVSHDLRAPLRSIDGYTQILIEDYAPKLDDEGRRVLNVVVNNARRMAKLIDDLLDFSRVGRKEISKTMINTESLVHAVISEMMAQEPGRIIDVSVGPLHESLGDPNLLRQVWLNFISNAFKYTRRCPQARVKIKSQKDGDEVVFIIEDNGTGFDMQYAGKLFGVFQRLHRQNDFEGTGVGLAIVHRIISRHGGRVWAEAKVGEGASFYFSLPTKDTIHAV